MSDDAGSPVDAFGGLVLMAFDLLDSEIGRSPERLVQTLQSDRVRKAAEKALIGFAKSRGAFASSQLTPEDIGKLQSSVIDGVRTAATDEYLRQIKSSSRFKGLEKQLKNFEDAAKSSAFGVWVDRNKNVLYVVGAALTVGAGVALYLTKPTGPVYAMGIRELEKLKFEVLKLGSLKSGSVKLGVSDIVFDPTADRYGGKLTSTVGWQKLKIDVSLHVIAKASGVTEINGEVMVKYDMITLTGIVRQNMTKPTVDLTIKLGANTERYMVAIAATRADDNLTGSASGFYKLNESLKLGVELSRQNRADLDNITENRIMIQLKGTFP